MNFTADRTGHDAQSVSSIVGISVKDGGGIQINISKEIMAHLLLLMKFHPHITQEEVTEGMA